MYLDFADIGGIRSYRRAKAGITEGLLRFGGVPGTAKGESRNLESRNLKWTTTAVQPWACQGRTGGVPAYQTDPGPRDHRAAKPQPRKEGKPRNTRKIAFCVCTTNPLQIERFGQAVFYRGIMPGTIFQEFLRAARFFNVAKNPHVPLQQNFQLHFRFNPRDSTNAEAVSKEIEQEIDLPAF